MGELEITLSKASFTTWFRGTNLVEISGNKAIISVPNNFAQEWFEKRYHKDITKVINRLTNNQVTNVVYEVGASLKPKPEPGVNTTTSPSPKSGYQKQAPIYNDTTETVGYGLTLKENYSFDNFVVGTTNRLAYAASMAVAQNPGKAHNPLVIYGGVGLGKTHLVQAIGNTIKQNQPKLKILYISCEDFANDYIQSIQSKKSESFKKKYRRVDVFLVDDIQFLSRKEGTQEEFFHTFNSLHQNNRQIVMTSDRIPTAIPDLEDRLSSRFSMGMVADVKAPNVETRQAILRGKVSANNLIIDDDVLDLIATNIQSNIRELEGAFNRVLAYSSMQDAPVTLDLAREVLKEFIGHAPSKNITAEKIIAVVAKHHGISQADLVGSKRNKEFIHPRRLAMYLIRSELKFSYPQIGRAVGGKDHSTVMHALKQLDKELAKDSAIQEEITTIKKEIYAE